MKADARQATRRSRLSRAPVIALTGALPVLLLSGGVARYMLNHFYAHAPYLLDSGLLSKISYRAGVFLDTPQAACNYATSFYQVYVSPFITLFSLLSYAVPVHRIEWFAFVQAMVYLPIALSVYLLSSRLEPGRALHRLPCTVLAACAFSLSGLVLWTIGYPHYEIATAGFSCLALTSIATGRTRLAWVFLVLAASVRQDGGVHAAIALAPLLYLQWRGVPMVPSRRALVIAIAGAIGLTVASFLFQRLFFTPVDRLRPIYLGEPAYAHLSPAVLAERAWRFLELGKVIYYPFLATVLIAALRRDARYLLGWAAALPWFVFNFTANDGAKATFQAYALSPFIVSVYWVYVYGALLAPAPRRLRPGLVELVFALVCLSSTLGFKRAAPDPFDHIVDAMAHRHPGSRVASRRIIKALHEHRASFGKLYLDGAVAALALDWAQPEHIWRPGYTQVDVLAFHERNPGSGWEMMSELVTNQLDVCTRVFKTGIVVCSRDRLPPEVFAGLATETVPSLFVFGENRPARRVVERGVEIGDEYAFVDWVGKLAPGAYELAMTFGEEERLLGACASRARVEIVQGDARLGSVLVPFGAPEARLRFQTTTDDPLVELRIRTTLSAPLRITSTRLRRLEPAGK
jgi:hypothetical protein